MTGMKSCFLATSAAFFRAIIGVASIYSGDLFNFGNVFFFIISFKWLLIEISYFSNILIESSFKPLACIVGPEPI